MSIPETKLRLSLKNVHGYVVIGNVGLFNMTDFKLIRSQNAYWTDGGMFKLLNICRLIKNGRTTGKLAIQRGGNLRIIA
jgi:hypothetical protein